jgi:hypothetical protein
VRIKDLTANLIPPTFSPGALQDKPLIHLHGFRDRRELWYATESAQMRYPSKSVGPATQVDVSDSYLI